MSKWFVAPPPWTLTGSALVLVAHFPEAFVRRFGFLAEYQQKAYRGWVGTVILADYTQSGVGPYGEVLFIPGLFRFGKITSFSISKIYVSTDDSVWNGRRNWGIPKERADFSFTTNPDGSRSVTVGYDGHPFISLRAKPWGLRVPVTTKLLPGFRVTQQQEQSLLVTRPSASGLARLARLINLQIDPVYFPDLKRIKLLTALEISNLRLIFPPPERR